MKETTNNIEKLFEEYEKGSDVLKKGHWTFLKDVLIKEKEAEKWTNVKAKH